MRFVLSYDDNLREESARVCGMCAYARERLFSPSCYYREMMQEPSIAAEKKTRENRKVTQGVTWRYYYSQTVDSTS